MVRDAQEQRQTSFGQKRIGEFGIARSIHCRYGQSQAAQRKIQPSRNKEESTMARARQRRCEATGAHTSRWGRWPGRSFTTRSRAVRTTFHHRTTRPHAGIALGGPFAASHYLHTRQQWRRSLVRPGINDSLSICVGANQSTRPAPIIHSLPCAAVIPVPGGRPRWGPTEATQPAADRSTMSLARRHGGLAPARRQWEIEGKARRRQRTESGSEARRCTDCFGNHLT